MSVLYNMMIADRIVSLGLLAAGLSHHIRNSLVAVKTFLDLAPVKMNEEKTDLQGLRNPDFWKDYHQNVQSQIERINDLLKDLWTASEIPRPRSPTRFPCIKPLATRSNHSKSHWPHGGLKLKTGFRIRCLFCAWTSRNSAAV